MLTNIILAFTSGALIILGGIGSILPILPGQPLSYAGLWLYAWYTGYETITPMVLIVFGILTTLTMVMDFVAPAIGAKGYKASKSGMYGSMLGAFLGVFILGPLGIIIGPFVGAFIGEMISVQNYRRAGQVAWGSLVGFIIGSVFKVAVIAGMFIYFVYALF